MIKNLVENDQAAFIQKNGKPIAVMISYERYERLLNSGIDINEKEDIRKVKGVYYTPTDIVKFILFNSVKMVCGRLKPNNLHVLYLNGIPYSSFC